MRKLTKTIALASLMAPTGVFSLGIGDITLHSALNQNLDAEIGLVLAPTENPSDISIKLAPPDKFDEAGVPWSYFLSKIKFNLVPLSDNRAVVKLSSNEVLKEPFLDFLVEVTWPNGKLYREFTVLVDPPATYQQPVVPVPSDYAKPAAEREYERVVGRPEARTVQEAGFAGDVYGPVGRNETLWSVASKVRPSADVSVEQTMIALYQNNPGAFYKDNVNALKAGSKLQVPETEVVLKLSHRQAVAEYERQNRTWKGQVAPPSAPPVKEAPIETQLTLMAPTQEEVADTERVVSGEKQEVVTTAPSLPKQPDTAVEEAAEGEQAELKARLEKLEQQLAVMQQMLALKDEQLAALQHKDQVEEVKVPSEPKQEVAPPPKTPPAPPVVAPKPKPKPVPPAVEPPTESGFFDDIYYWLMALVSVGLLSGLGWLWWRRRQVEKESETDSMFAASSQISLPSTDEGVSLLSTEEESAYDVGTVGESSFLSEFTPSDFDAFDSDQHEVDPISEADVYLAYGRYQQAEELIRHAIAENPGKDDYKLKLLEIFYANENSEAFNEYADELKQAGKDKNDAFWGKVLEMASEISPGSALFSADFDMPDEEDDVPAVAVATADDSDETLRADEIGAENELDFDLSSFEEPDEDEIEQKTGANEEPEAETDLNEDADNGLDFDLESYDFTMPESKEEPKKDDKASEAEHNDNQIEFDLKPASAETAVEESSDDDKQKTQDVEELESFDFDLGSFGTDEKAEAEDFSNIPDLGDFDVSLPEKEKDQPAESVEPLEDAGFDFDFNFDLGDVSKKSSEGDGDFSADLDLGVSDLTDMDEFETKLDLARAYIDMGDSEAAADIAGEVLEKGNDEQKKAAQSILDSLK